MIISNANSCDNNTTSKKKNQSKNLCYIYRRIRLDRNEVFYIGKGTNTNGKYTRSKDKNRSNPLWNNVVNKTKYRIEIMLECLPEEEANRKEREFIKLYGRRDKGTGTLVNMTEGGEGSSGAIRSEETRKKQSDANKGNTNSLGHKHTDEARKKQSDAQPKKKVGQYKDGILIKEYPSTVSVTLDGFNRENVSACCNGKIKSHGGYEWGFI